MKELAENHVGESVRDILGRLRSLEINDPDELARAITEDAIDLSPGDRRALESELVVRFGRRGEFTGTPSWLAYAIAQIAETCNPSSICDPWSNSGFLLGTLHDVLQPAKMLAVARSSSVYALGSAILPRADWHREDPLDFLTQSSEEIDLVVSNLPFNARAEQPLQIELGSGVKIELNDYLGNLMLVV